MTPESEQLRREKMEDALAKLDVLAQKISVDWMVGKSGTEILEEMREERSQSLMLDKQQSERGGTVVVTKRP